MLDGFATNASLNGPIGFDRDQSGNLFVVDSMGNQIRKIDPSGRSALTRFKIIKSWGRFHLVCLMPHTGRTHQLRVHLKSIGIPIIQDLDYNGRSLSRWVSRVQLHHYSIRLFHPRTAKLMLFRCPLLEDMRELISRFEQGEVYTWSY